MTIEIERGVPPPVMGAGGRPATYPFASMQVGDSFFVPGKTAAQFGGIVSAARIRRKDWRFVCRTVDGGVRVWRVE